VLDTTGEILANIAQFRMNRRNANVLNFFPFFDYSISACIIEIKMGFVTYSQILLHEN
jgi:hypothetical protein